MGKGNFDPVDVARQCVLSWDCPVDPEENINALRRLANSDEAIVAWRKLAEKVSETTFREAASSIVRATACSHLELASKRTKREICEAANDAAASAEKLIRLITHNETLRAYAEIITPPEEQVALSRILDGLISQAVRNQAARQENEDQWFHSEIERELDDLQARDSPQFKGMTTSEAYRILQYGRGDGSFLDMLHRFATFARESSEFDPIVPRPKSKSTDAHIFALSVCSTLDCYCGTPCHAIAAHFASAVFETEIDEEIVKKWWQRAGDNYRGNT